jgi:hypothetical protein
MSFQARVAAGRFAGPELVKVTRGGTRVIYFNADKTTIWLLIVYTKAKFDHLPAAFLAELKKGVEDAL